MTRGGFRHWGPLVTAVSGMALFAWLAYIGRPVEAAPPIETVASQRFMECIAPVRSPWDHSVKVRKFRLKACLNLIVREARQGGYGPCREESP